MKNEQIYETPKVLDLETLYQLYGSETGENVQEAINACVQALIKKDAPMLDVYAFLHAVVDVACSAK